MKDLFLPEIENIPLEKIAESQALFLNRDATQWIKEITSLFLQRFPFLQDEPLSINWTKKDSDKGYAVGVLKVLGNGVVPLIIKDFRLSPLDVLILPEATLPLNDYFLKKLYHTPEIFSGLADARHKSTENLFGGDNYLQYSPTGEYNGSGGGNVHVVRDAVKVASVIDNLSYINQEDAKFILNEIQDEAIKLAFEQNGHNEVFHKIANKAKLTTKEAYLNSFLRNLDIDRQLVYKDSNGNSFVKQANSKVNKTWVTSLDSLEAYETEKVIANTKLAQKSERVKIASEAEELKLEEGQIGKFITPDYTSGNLHITKVAKLDEQPKAGYFAGPGLKNDYSDSAIAITKEGAWSYLNINDTEFEKKAEKGLNFEEFEGTAPKIGDYGVFVTKLASTAPFEVVGMSKVAGEGNYVIKGEQGLNKINFYPISMSSEKMAGFLAHEKEKSAHYVPSDAKFIKLSGQDNKLKALRDFEAKIRVEGLNGFKKHAFFITDEKLEKTAQKVGENEYLLSDEDLFFGTSEKFTEIEKNASANFSNHEVERDASGLFNLRGPEFAKYAQEAPIRNLNLHDTQWIALHCGATESDLSKIATLAKNRRSDLEGDIKSPESLSTIDKLAEKRANASKEDPKLKSWKNLVKVAAHFSDRMSVDAVLSLSMLRKRNVEEYLMALPIFERALSELCKLLVASRLGLDHTDPDALKLAVEGISDAVIQLHKLKASATDIT